MDNLRKGRSEFRSRPNALVSICILALLVGSGWVGPLAWSQDVTAVRAGRSVFVNAQDGDTQDPDAETNDAETKVPPALSEYKGRKIAQTMHYLGAPWLIREEREREERCSLMLTNSKIKPGMTVCDIGCGNGFYTFRLAEMVGPQGRVYAVDIQPEMLTLLREEMEKRGVENVIPVLGSVHNPRLPRSQIDAIILADVYHEFSHPEQMLAAMRDSLKPDGFAILLEFRAEDDTVPIKPLHKMSKAQIFKEWPVNGFKLVDEFDRLSWQHMLFFSPDPQYQPAQE